MQVVSAAVCVADDDVALHDLPGAQRQDDALVVDEATLVGLVGLACHATVVGVHLLWDEFAALGLVLNRGDVDALEEVGAEFLRQPVGVVLRDACKLPIGVDPRLTRVHHADAVAVPSADAARERLVGVGQVVHIGRAAEHKVTLGVAA